MAQVTLEPIEEQTEQMVTLEPIQEQPPGGAVNRLKQYYEYLHTPTEGPKSVKDFLTRVVPASLEKTAYGLIEFPYQVVKSVTDPIIHEKGVKAGATKLGKNLYENVEGLARFSGEQIGVYGWDKLKERWSTDPIGSVLGLAPLIKGVVSYAKTKGITPKEAVNEIVLDKTFSNFERLKEEQVKAVQNKLAGGQRPLGKLVTLERMAESEGKIRGKVGGEDYAKNIFTEENLQRTEDLVKAQKGFDERLKPEEQTLDQLHEQAYGEKVAPEELAKQQTEFDTRMAGKEPEPLIMDKIREAAVKEEALAKGEISGFYPAEERAKAAVGGTEGIREKVLPVEELIEKPVATQEQSNPQVFFHATDTPITEWKPGQKVNFSERPMTEDFGNHVYKMEVELKRPAPDMDAYQTDLAQKTGKYDGVIVEGTDYQGKPIKWGIASDPSSLKNIEYQGPKAGEVGVEESRTIKNIISDINTAMGEKGAIGNIELSPEQIAARKRLLSDFDKIKANAANVGKNIDDYLSGLGVDEKVISSMKGVVKEQPVKEGEGIVINKGDYVGESGEKVRSFAVTAATSDLVAPEVKSGIIEEIKPGGKGVYEPITLKDAQAEAVKKITQDTEKAVRFLRSSRNPGAVHTAVGEELIKKFQSEGNHERATEVALDLSKRLTKAGQEIVAARLMGKLSPEGILITANRAIEEFNNKSLRKAGVKLVPGWVKQLELGPDTAKNLHDLAKAIKEAKDEKVKIELSQELQNALNAITPSTIGQKISTLQIIAQLFNPKTIVTRNPLGNELFYRVERMNKYPTALVDWAASNLGGGDRYITFRTGGAGRGKYWEGWLTGWKAGFEGVNPQGLQTQYDLGRKPAFRNKPYEIKLDDGTWTYKMPNRAERVASFLERTMGATLKSFDYAAYNRAYWNTIGEMATLRSMNEVGKVDPKLVQQYIKTFDENVNKTAMEYGKYVTFQDNNIISVGLNRAKKAMNLGFEFGYGDMILKYPKTPGALLARGLEYSPAGILKATYEATKPLFTDNKLDNRALSLSVGRAIFGTMGLSALGYYFFDQGIITGPTNKDKDVASAQRTMGTHPYKVNISAFKRWAFSGGDTDQVKPQEGDTYYSYDWAQPVAMAIAGGANMAKEYEERKVFTKAFRESMKGAPHIIYRGMESALETLVAQPVLQGLLKLSQGYGAEGVASSIVNIATEVPASFTPTLLNQIRQITDNTKRSIYDPDMMAVTINKMTNKIPGLAGYLPETYDTLGYKKEVYPQKGNNPFNVMLNPGFVSKFLPTTGDSKVMRVYEKTGSTKAFPREVGKVIGIPVLKGKMQDTLQVELTAKEYISLQKNVGKITRQMFSKIPDDMPVEAQEMIMVSMLTYAGIMGRQAIIPSIKTRLKDQLKQEQIILLK